MLVDSWLYFGVIIVSAFLQLLFNHCNCASGASGLDVVYLPCAAGMRWTLLPKSWRILTCKSHFSLCWPLFTVFDFAEKPGCVGKFKNGRGNVGKKAKSWVRRGRGRGLVVEKFSCIYCRDRLRILRSLSAVRVDNFFVRFLHFCAWNLRQKVCGICCVWGVAVFCNLVIDVARFRHCKLCCVLTRLCSISKLSTDTFWCLIVIMHRTIFTVL